MKGLGIFILLAAALVLGLYFLGRREPPPAPAAAPVASQVATPTSTPAPVARATPVAGPPTSAPNPTVEAAARKARVTLISYQRQGGRATFAVEWSSDVLTQGMDFVENLLTAGVIRDFDMESIQRRESLGRDGRRLHRVTGTVIY